MSKRSHIVPIALVAALGALMLASHDHRADIRVLAHRPDDLAPQKMQAIVDLGLGSVSLLVTWSKRLGY